ncbi:MAG: SpoIVB peptidase S55 domain-containing protein, partial [Candidatus Bipolaricaulia bacterium]
MQNRRLFLRLSLTLLVLAVLTFALTAGGRDRGQFMFLDELQPGMQGICKTVVRGGEISTFNFEVIDVIRLPKDNSMILTRTWGDAITESGGIAAGMSGSPCYINDKLIGALFAVYVEDGFHDIASIEEKPHALLQPIEYMLQVLDTCEAGAAAPAGAAASDLSNLPQGPTSVTSLTGQIHRIEVFTDRLPREDLEANDGTLFIRPLASPVMVGGLSTRMVNWMANGVDPQLLNGDKALFQLRGERAFESFAQPLTAGVERRYG